MLEVQVWISLSEMGVDTPFIVSGEQQALPWHNGYLGPRCVHLGKIIPTLSICTLKTYIPHRRKEKTEHKYSHQNKHGVCLVSGIF